MQLPFRMNERLGEFSLSKISKVLGPSFMKQQPKQSTIQSQIWKKIMNEIFNFGSNQFKLQKQLQQLTKHQISKQQYYEAMYKFLFIELNRIIFLLKKDTKKENNQKIQEKVPDQFDHLYAQLQEKAKQIDNIIIKQQKYFGWGCGCNRTECTNRWANADLFEISLKYIYRELSQDVFSEKKYDYVQYQDINVIKYIPHDQLCLPNIQQPIKKQKKRRNKNKNKNYSQSSTTHEQKVQNSRQQQIIELQQNSIDKINQLLNMFEIDQHRINCNVNELWIQKLEQQILQECYEEIQ